MDWKKEYMNSVNIFNSMFREAILEALKKRGITQVELANYLGINKSPLNAFLKGKGKISMENIEKSFFFLGIDIILKNR